MKHTVLLLVILCSITVNAQYYQAILQMADGSQKEGLAKLPSNQMLDGNLEFKTSSKGTIEKIEHDNIYQILYTSDQGGKFLFERSPVVHLYRAFGKEYELEKNQNHWILMFHANPSVQAYSLSEKYRIDKKGTMHSITSGYSFWETVYFLLRRPAEDKAYIVSGRGFTNGQVRKAMAIFFKDKPNFVKRIEDNEFKKSNVDDVADAYDKSN